jgi:hypothetical protein
MRLFTPRVNACPNWGTWVNVCPKGGGYFWKILFALLATWFIFLFFYFLYVITFFSIFLSKQALYLYNISCIVDNLWQSSHWYHHSKVKVKDKGHFMVKAKCQRNLYFLSSCYQINCKLGVKVEYGLPLTWLVLRADQHWPSMFLLRVKIA